VRVEVTWEDIQNGTRRGTYDNPLALAFSRAVGVPVCVYNDRSNGWVAEYRLPGAELATTFGVKGAYAGNNPYQHEMSDDDHVALAECLGGGKWHGHY
jgi:hypothetical protein